MKSKHTITEWVLCSEDWRDIVITYVPQINNLAIEDILCRYIPGKNQKGIQTEQKKSTEEGSGSMIAYVKFIL